MKEIESETTNNLVKNEADVRAYEAPPDVSGTTLDAADSTPEQVIGFLGDPKCGPGERFNKLTNKCEPV
jgi:hypothetical protein